MIKLYRNIYLKLISKIYVKGRVMEEKLLTEINVLKEKLEVKKLECQEINEEFIQAKAKSERNEKMLHSLVEAAAGKIGQDFFDNIVTRLAEWLNADCVLIGQKTEDERIDAIPMYLDGKILHGFSYALKDTPCDITTRKGFCAYPENVINLFPKDEILVEMNAEGYIGSALYNENGETNGVICAVSRKKIDIPPYARDIMKIIGSRVTAEIERKKIEDALAKSEAELRESNNAKDKYFSILAHDLMSPLSTTFGYSSFLLSNYDTLSSEEIKEYIKIIDQSTKNIIALSENLLTWARSEQGLIKAARSQINLQVLAKETIALLQDMANKKQISLQLDIQKNYLVMANRNMLLTIFRNLLSNAIKFTPEGGKVRIGCIPDIVTDPEKIEIFVEDNGVGIEAEELDGIFRLDKDYASRGTNDEPGTGLGLVICKEFIEKNNGKMTVTSKTGKGSRFSFTLDKAG